jgi:glycine dehydrogenase subunit 1
LAASVYLASLGKTGLKRIAELNMENACYLRDALSKLKGVEIATQGAIFNEFAIRFTKPANVINEGLLKKGIIGGVSLERFYPELKNQLLICATETKSKEDLDQFISAIEGIAK